MENMQENRILGKVINMANAFAEEVGDCFE